MEIKQTAFIAIPKKIPVFLRLGIWLAERITLHEMLPAKLLSWYPKAAIGSGVLESLVAHKDGELDERILKMVRVRASYAASCAFCIDMNSAFANEAGITSDEMAAIQGRNPVAGVMSFSKRELIALEYASLISASPLKFPAEFILELKQTFTEREIVILASTAAQVNYWARLIQALGIPPAGFTTNCDI
jgi:AhpD family alkylhydroperoxidase